MNVSHSLVPQEVSLSLVSFGFQRSFQRLLRIKQRLVDVWNAGLRAGLGAVVGAGSDGLGDPEIDNFPNLTEQTVVLEARKVFLLLSGRRRFTVLLILLSPVEWLILRRRRAGNEIIIILVLQVSLLGGLACLLLLENGETPRSGKIRLSFSLRRLRRNQLDGSRFKFVVRRSGESRSKE